MTFSSQIFAEDTTGGGEDLNGCSKEGCECINDLSRDEEGKSILSDDSSGTGTSGASTLK